MEQSEKVGFYSLGINVFLVVLKGVLGWLSGSIGLIADAIHSLTDVISSGTVVAGIKLSRRKSKNFPYGLYKVENLVSLVSSILIFLAGYEIIRMVFTRAQRLEQKYIPYAIAGVVCTMGITYFFSRYELREGERLASPALTADAKHIRTDMFSSLVILVGLVGGIFGWGIDKIAGGIVAIIVFKAGAEIFMDAIRVLLDASLDYETLDAVKSIILRDPEVGGIKSLRGRNSGPFKFIEAEIVILARDLEKAHQVSQRIENAIKAEIEHVDRVIIHYEPQQKDIVTYAVPVNRDRSGLAEHFGEAPFFYIVSVKRDDGSIVEEGFFRNPAANEEKGKGIKVSKWLLEKGVDKVFSPKELGGKGPGYVFSNAGVDVIIVAQGKLDEIKNGVQSGVW
ncbi:MAG: cation transporter [Deltaproteobacteria bacterium]|nr:MAG: cation transporter [Deltaproteobacteria bacterium]